MPQELRALCLVLAVVAFVIAAAVDVGRLLLDNRVRIISAGLALFALPFMWDALELL